MEKLKDSYRMFVVPLQILEDENLTSQEKLIFVVLRSFANPHTNVVFPSRKTIAKLASVSVSSVKRSINKLVEKGYLIKEKRYEYNHENKTARRTSNNLTFAMPVTEGGHSEPGGGHREPGGGVTVNREGGSQ